MPRPVKSLKRKSSFQAKNKKTSSKRRKNMKSPKTNTAAESEVPDRLERLSAISCECRQSAGRRRCSASPERVGQEGKENELRAALESDGCRSYGTQEKRENENMDCEETSKSLYPDDDSNQILPVEQFFGNLDAVQDFPQRTSVSSAQVRRQNRRRHYYAREDSDEEEAGLGSGGDPL